MNNYNRINIKNELDSPKRAPRVPVNSYDNFAAESPLTQADTARNNWTPTFNRKETLN